MELFGKKIQISQVDPFEKQRNANAYGPVALNIQVREKGVTIADGCGIRDPIIGKDASLQAILLAHAMAEKFAVDWTAVVSQFKAEEVSLWLDKAISLKTSGVPDPTYRAFQEVIELRNKPKEQGVQYQ